MDEPLRPVDLRRVKTGDLRSRRHKVTVEQFARASDADASLADFLENMSDLLAVRDLRGLAAAVVAASAGDRMVVWAMGAHPIKVGVSPVLIRLLHDGILRALVLNGAAAIHDWEIAAVGATSEDVGPALDVGQFGMVDETGREFAAAAAEAVQRGEGLGTSLGRRICEAQLPYREFSLLAAAHELEIPTTVHVALGCDTVHMHPAADGAAVGVSAHHDFRRACALVARCEAGVWINCGSAVQLPEIFLKALTVARNLGHDVDQLTTANLDLQLHYRVARNVLERPTRRGGASFNLVGHHEINVPLLAAAICHERRRRSPSG